jgi:hypothetical protein
MGGKFCFHVEGKKQAKGGSIMGADTIFRRKTEETIGHEIKLFNDELRCLHSLPVTVQVVKLERMRWVGRVVYVQGR